MNAVSDRPSDTSAFFHPFDNPRTLPFSLRIGEEKYRGFPEGVPVCVEARIPEEKVSEFVFEGTLPGGIKVRAECLEYSDCPVREIFFTVKNDSDADSGRIGDMALSLSLPLKNPIIKYGNGDTCRSDGYSFFETDLSEPLSLSPTSGTSCQGAFPYFTVTGEEYEARIAVGWPGKWRADFSAENGTVSFSCSQDRLGTILHPGETLRSPRMTFMIYEKGCVPYTGINTWRRWYLKHILPHGNGDYPGPALCLHNFMAGGMPEFTGADEENQTTALETYISRGLRPDIWWIDAGWYPCGGEWKRTGTWRPDDKRFPDGLAPIGRKCRENGVKLLLWFEPERVYEGSELDSAHPEWLLTKRNDDGTVAKNRLLNLGNTDALSFICRHVDGLIKTSGVGVYRQDFNFDPLPYWIQNEGPDRTGYPENAHIQGYLAYWDYLLSNNPGLLIDSCASGGRRNDLETMRRAVTLHYTDVGYGNHPIKQKQHREMFEWIPYFRAHDMNWFDRATKTYGKSSKTDPFSYQNAFTPAMTSMIKHDAPKEDISEARKYSLIQKRAARLELDGDFYPLTECRADPADAYAIQFDSPERNEGFVQIIMNHLSPDSVFRAFLHNVRDGRVYRFEDPVSGNAFEATADEIKRGLELKVDPGQALILFYSSSD